MSRRTEALARVECRDTCGGISGGEPRTTGDLFPEFDSTAGALPSGKHFDAVLAGPNRAPELEDFMEVRGMGLRRGTRHSAHERAPQLDDEESGVFAVSVVWRSAHS